MISHVALLIGGGVMVAAGMAVLFEAVAVRWFHPVTAIDASAEIERRR